MNVDDTAQSGQPQAEREPVIVTCPACGRPDHPFWPCERDAKLDTTLQLLIIDLGDTCVVKVEKGVMPHTSSDPIKDLGFYGTLSIVRTAFDNLRAALDGEKPEIRIDCKDDGDYCLYFNDGDSVTFRQNFYDALTEINGGKPLPVYEPAKGEWAQLGVLPELIPVNNIHPEQPIASFGDVLGYVQPLPFKAWKYTRESE